MNKILIFGNSGSGKSTLAKSLCKANNLAHLDLDTLAWLPTMPPERKPLKDSEKEILHFIRSNKGWVIEGCYTDLLELAKEFSVEIIFMNLPVDLCVSNAKERPWEPHKYASKEAQDKNLQMLIDWIRQYRKRNDTFSKTAHQKFYDSYNGTKREVKVNLKNKE